MMELKYTPSVANNGKQEFPLSSSSNKNSVTNKKGTADFQKVFNDSKTKTFEESSKSNETTQKPSGVGQESSGITVVDKPVVEEKEWSPELSKEEQEKIKKAVDLLLAFFEKYFPKKTEETEEIPESEEENEILSGIEKVVSEEEKAKELAQALGQELGMTAEKAQEILANLKNLPVVGSRLSEISAELVASLTQALRAENLATANPSTPLESAIVPNVQHITGENAKTLAQPNIITNVANPNGIAPKVEGQNASIVAKSVETKNVEVNLVANSTETKNLEANLAAKSVETKNVEQTLKNLVGKTVTEEPITLVTAPQIEKLSSTQMPALQSHANFIVGKLNSDSMAKSNSKAVDKVDSTLSATVSTQPTVNMMSLQTKLGQQFADLQNSHKNNLEQSIKPLQDSNAVKSTYAELLFPNNKNVEPENVELNLLQDRAAISRQIVDNIKLMQRNNNTEMVIKLKPEHMGEMILRISTNAAGTISASFQTNNPEARLALESTMLALKQELAANGLKVQDVDLFGGISDFLSGQSQANKDQKSNHSRKSFVEQQEEKVENIVDKLGVQELTDDGNVDYRI